MTEIPPPKPGDLAPMTRDVSADQIVNMMSAAAASQAMDAVRQRLNLAIGLLATLVALVGGVVLVALDRRIETLAAPIVEAEIEGQLTTATLLPLMVSEATSFSTVGRYTTPKANRLLSALELLRDDIIALEGVNRELALRRPEDILDAFNGAGDYYRVRRTFDLFGAELLAFDGIVHTMANTYASEIVLAGRVPAHLNGRIGPVLLANTEPGSGASIHQEILRIMVRLAERDWNKAALRAILLRSVAQYPAITQETLVFALNLEAEFAEDGLNSSVDAEQRRDMIELVASVIMGFEM